MEESTLDCDALVTVIGIGGRQDFGCGKDEEGMDGWMLREALGVEGGNNREREGTGTRQARQVRQPTLFLVS